MKSKSPNAAPSKLALILFSAFLPALALASQAPVAVNGSSSAPSKPASETAAPAKTADQTASAPAENTAPATTETAQNPSAADDNVIPSESMNDHLRSGEAHPMAARHERSQQH